jgi:diphthamide synthase subunit DPH2
MKKILHFQFELKKDGFPLISPTMLSKFMKLMNDRLGDEFVLVTSPCTPSLLSPDDKLYNFDMSQISFQELMKMIEPEEEKTLENRRVMIFVNDEWVVEKDLSKIKDGMAFRLFEPDGTPVKNSLNNDDVFIASRDAYRNEEGIWTFEIQ